MQSCKRGWGAQKSSSDTHGCPWVSFLFSNMKGPSSALLVTKMLHSLPHFRGPAQDCSSKSIFSFVAVCTVISGCCFPETHKGRTKHARRWETPELLQPRCLALQWVSKALHMEMGEGRAAAVGLPARAHFEAGVRKEQEEM